MRRIITLFFVAVSFLLSQQWQTRKAPTMREIECGLQQRTFPSGPARARRNAIHRPSAPTGGARARQATRGPMPRTRPLRSPPIPPIDHDQPAAY